jgi:hypothetical protein
MHLFHKIWNVLWYVSGLSITAFLCMISGLRCDVDEICAFLEYYAALSGGLYGHFGTTFRSHLQELRSPRLLYL